MIRNLKLCFVDTLTISLSLIFLVPTGAWGKCICVVEEEQHKNGESLKLKVAAIATVLVAGGIGVSLPQLGKKIDTLRPENDIFFMVKAFAAGVILGTGFVHVLPDAFEALTSPCLGHHPWGEFPFTGFVAMVSSIGTLMVDSFATTFCKRMHLKHKQVNVDEEQVLAAPEGQHQIHVHPHTHASHGHAHGATSTPLSEIDSSELLRHRIISQVLEVGIVVHSVIIGISLGASTSPSTIKPLLAALCFHQFFEGMGLGGCILQAKFKSLSTTIMALFFSLTTPVGIAIGIGISNIYNNNSQTALIVEGVLNSASAGILIYMALVDLLAEDFKNPRMQEDWRVQVGANVSLLLGAVCMSVMARWA